MSACDINWRVYDQQWIETAQRSATYSRMPAGGIPAAGHCLQYSGVWNQKGAMLSFIVLPFFWQTWWFRLGFLSIFTAGLIALVYYLSVRRLRQKLLHLEQESAVQKDRARIAKDLHDDWARI
ncbi:MAG: hypothetical protein WDM76_19355 [Limisphaerales bacterium]